MTGVSGQDGSYLAEFLLARGYTVVGAVRDPRAPLPNIDGIRARLTLVDVDLLDVSSLERAVREARPDEVYNLAAPSFVPRSWQEPAETAEFGAVGATHLLEAVRAAAPGARVYQACSSEMFGESAHSPQDESTPIRPLTPYGAAKAYAFFIVQAYRRRYGLHASCGILYNHESPRRPLDFVPRKVANGAARIALGLDDTLVLGDLDARRDWGYAADYVHAMWLMLQQEEPDDYVVATGVSHSVCDLVEVAFAHVGLAWQRHVRTDDSLRRGAAELHNLVGDASRARQRLGWEPSLDMESLMRLLVDADLAALQGTQQAAIRASS